MSSHVSDTRSYINHFIRIHTENSKCYVQVMSIFSTRRNALLYDSQLTSSGPSRWCYETRVLLSIIPV